MKKGDRLILDIEKYAYEGKGIAKITRGDKNNYVVFVEGAYPGDKVEVSLRKIKNSYSEAKVENVIVPSTDRTTYPCKYFGVCGGCKNQNMDYERQVFYKDFQVKEIFEKQGGYKELNFEPILSSSKIFFYRNKMEFSFAAKRWLSPDEMQNEIIEDKNFALGLHIPGLYDKVLDINECFLQSAYSNRILNFTRKFFKDKGLDIYETKTNSGYLRNLVVRQTNFNNEIMVNLVTFYEDNDLIDEYTKKLLEEVPQITTIVNNINLRKALVAAGDYEKVVYGSGSIYEKLGDFKFRISANSFFQTNTLQAENLYNIIVDFAKLKKDETVYDLYAGACTISIYISNLCKRVYSFETVDSALADAKENLELNNITNVYPNKADLYKTFLNIIEEKNIPAPDVMVIDPPRSGMNPVTVQDVISLNPKRIVYVSCNPTTQVRDLKELTNAGYAIKRVRPVDMFPHTYHIENIVLLEK